jgi:hypothetical protein
MKTQNNTLDVVGFIVIAVNHLLMVSVKVADWDMMMVKGILTRPSV